MTIQTPKKSDLENAKKFPWQWVTIILCGAVAACEERVQLYSKAITRKDSMIFYWQSKYIGLSNELLYKNNIIDRQQDVIDKTDSVARNKLEKPAKQIVKNHE